MSHLDDGTLRRLIDEPAGGGAGHAAACAACRDRIEALRTDAAPARAALAGPGDDVDVAAALTAVRSRAADFSSSTCFFSVASEASAAFTAFSSGSNSPMRSRILSSWRRISCWQKSISC